MLATAVQNPIITIWLTNLSAYTAGVIIDKPLDLPTDPETITAALKEIGVDGNNTEPFIPAYTSEYNFSCNEFDNIYRVNEEAQALADLDIDPEILAALINEGYTAEEIENLDYMIYSDCDDMTDVAEQYAEEVGLLESIPENLRFYFDFEKFGRDMSFEHHWIAYNNGYICVF